MTDGSITDAAGDRAAQDHEVVLRYLKSDDWEEQLRVARLKREEVLADRARGRATARVEDAATVEAAAPDRPAPDRPAPDSPPAAMPPAALSARSPAAPDATTPTRFAALAGPGHAPAVAPALHRRAALGLAIGLAAGIGIGLLLPPLATALLPRAERGQPMAAAPAAPPGPSFGSAVADRPASPPTNPADPTAAAPAPIPPASATTLPNAALPEVWPGEPALHPADVPDSSASAGPAPLTPDAPPAAGWSALTFALPQPDPSDAAPASVPVPQRVTALAYAPPDQLPSTGGRTAEIAGPLRLAAPLPQTLPRRDGNAPALAWPGPLDTAPVLSEGIFIAGAESYRVKLHLTHPQTAPDVLARLGALGLVNVSVMPTAFGPSQTVVAYYRHDDAQTARTLASLYGGQTLDLSGFSPAPADQTLDIYLTD